jgi:hypothetical protein
LARVGRFSKVGVVEGDKVPISLTRFLGDCEQLKERKKREREREIKGSGLENKKGSERDAVW